MAQACPLLFRQIDGTVARINAVSVTLLVVLYLATFQPLWLYILGCDFMIRLYGSKSYSPIQRISLWTQKAMRLEPKMTDAGAKRLAAHFGLLFTVLLLIGHYLGLHAFGVSLASVFLLCLTLELLFNYCVGCKIYFVIKKVYPEF
jgi:hypothetical protein